MREVQADPSAGGPVVSTETGASTAPYSTAARSRVATGAVGVLLDGRYRLLQRRTKDGAAATWDGEDDQLQRPVVLHVVAGASAAEAVDAARRSAAVEDERLPHLLDVGLDRAADGTALGWVVTERCPGRPLADLLREAPLPAARARALVGEAAAVLARASRSGLHHRRLDPSTVLLTADGAVTVLGLEVAAAAAGLPAVPAADADREDAVGLTRLLYAALTGLWPAGRCGPLGAAPTGRGGAPVVPGDLAGGVPADLDALCAAVLGPYDDGPRTPAEVASALAPWGSSTGPVTRTGLGIPVTPALRPARPARRADGADGADGVPGAAGAAAGWASAPARARLGGGPDLRFTGSDASEEPRPAAVDAPNAARAAEPAAPEPADGDGTRVLRRPTVAAPAGSRTLTPSQEVPEHPTRASRRAAQRRAEREAAGSAEAFDALLGPVTGPRSAVAAPADRGDDRTDHRAVAPTVAVGRGRAGAVQDDHQDDHQPDRRPVLRPAAAGASTFDDTDATDWVSAGWGSAPAGAEPVQRSARRAPAEEPRRSRRTAAVLLAVVAVTLVVLLALALTHLAQLRGVLGIAPASTTTATGTTDGAAGSGSAPVAGGPSDEPSASAAASGPGEVTAATAADPFGDDTENDGGAQRAVDGDPATAWSSSTYTTAALGGLKRGVGLSLVLGDGTTPSTVSALELTTQGSGGTVEVRTSPDGGYDGSSVVATAAAGTGGSPRGITLDEPVTATHLLLWFTSLPQSDGGYSAVVDEVSAR